MIGPPLVAVALLVGLLVIPLANGLAALRQSRRDDAAFWEQVRARPALFNWADHPDL